MEYVLSGTFKYEHPKKYEGARNQNIVRLIVEENCIKCSEFMGQSHDFTNCDSTGKYCPKPFKHPSLLNAQDFLKFDVVKDIKNYREE